MKTTVVLLKFVLVINYSIGIRMSQKTISAYFTKLPANRTIKRSLSEVENIDSSNVIPDSKKTKKEELAVDELNKSQESSDSKMDDNSVKQKIENNKLSAELKLLSKTYTALHPNIGLTWFQALRSEFEKPYFTKLSKFIADERARTTSIFPRPDQVWTWTRECRTDEIKAVIIGQDPYHHPGQAHGLSFSVPVGVPPPPSLINIYKELEDDIKGFRQPGHGYLVGWARQGVLLLNAVLTVKCRTPNSHKDQGWEKLTDAVIKHLNSNFDGLVFFLWGSYAQKKAEFVDQKRHHMLKSVHPSPLSASRGFFGSKHFSQCNQLLIKQGKKPIDWNDLPTE